VERTADLGDHIPRIILKHADRVFDDATTLDATIHMFYSYAPACNLLICSFLIIG